MEFSKKICKSELPHARRSYFYDEAHPILNFMLTLFGQSLIKRNNECNSHSVSCLKYIPVSVVHVLHWCVISVSVLTVPRLPYTHILFYLPVFLNCIYLMCVIQQHYTLRNLECQLYDTIGPSYRKETDLVKIITNTGPMLDHLAILFYSMYVSGADFSSPAVVMTVILMVGFILFPVVVIDYSFQCQLQPIIKKFNKLTHVIHRLRAEGHESGGKWDDYVAVLDEVEQQKSLCQLLNEVSKVIMNRCLYFRHCRCSKE